MRQLDRSVEERLPFLNEPPREVRLAVTMVGGTSLAIYENGAAQELFKLVHGVGAYGLVKRLTHSHAYLDILSGTSAGGINAVFLSFALANGCDLAPTREVWIEKADIEALLQDGMAPEPHSILRGNDYYLPELEKAFRAIAASGYQPGPKDVPSLQRDPAGSFVPWEDLDVFITGTYLEGRPETFYDCREAPIFSVSHNGVFHLRHRPRRLESHLCVKMCDPQGHSGPGLIPPAGDRVDQVAPRLAQIARATSSLPVAFEPARIEHRLMEGIIPLPKGGPRQDGTSRTYSYFGDGGYLNNRPLDLVLEQVLRRRAGPEIARKLVFVEPVAEDHAPDAAKNDPPEPTALEHLQFYLGVQGQQSISDQLRDARDHNHKAQDLSLTLACLRQNLSGRRAHIGPSHEGPDPTLQLWARLRLRDIRSAIIQEWSRDLGLQEFDGADRDGLRGQRATRIRQMADALLEALQTRCRDLEPGGATASSFSLDQIDILSLKRRVWRLSDEIRKVLYPVPDPRAAPQWRAPSIQARRKTVLDVLPNEDARNVQECVDSLYFWYEVLEIIEQNLQPVIRAVRRLEEWEAGDAHTEPEMIAQARVDHLVQASQIILGAPEGEGDRSDPLLEPIPYAPLDDKAQTLHLKELRDGLSERSLLACQVLENRQPLATPPPGHLLRDVEARVLALGLDAARLLRPVLDQESLFPNVGETPLFSLFGRSRSEFPEDGDLDRWTATGLVESLRQGLRALDQEFYPVERAADIAAQNPVDIVHVSARDVQLGASHETADRKLAGDVLADLGGFLKRSWRVNDILWGRLDASSALLDTLLEPDRLHRVFRSQWSECQGGENPQLSFEAWLAKSLDSFVATGSAFQPRGTAPTPSDRDDVGTALWSGYQNDRAGLFESALQFAQAVRLDGENDFPKRLRTLILGRHHLEILNDDLPRAIAEALSEEIEWQGRGETGGWGSPVSLEVRRRGVPPQDPGYLPRPEAAGGAAGAALREGIRKWVKGLFTADGPSTGGALKVRAFFAAHYNVGQETLAAGIPPLVNLYRAVRALLVTIHVLEGAIERPPRKNGVAGVLRPLTAGLRPVAWLLTAMYGFLALLRQGKRTAIAVHTGAWIAILLLFASLLVTTPHKGWLGPIVCAAAGLLVVELFICITALGRTVLFAVTLIGLGLAYCALDYSGKLGPAIHPFVWFGTTAIGRFAARQFSAGWYGVLGGTLLLLWLSFRARVPNRAGTLMIGALSVFLLVAAGAHFNAVLVTRIPAAVMFLAAGLLTMHTLRQVFETEFPPTPSRLSASVVPDGSSS